MRMACHFCMARFLLILKFINRNSIIMGEACKKKRTGRGRNALYFFAITAVAAAACVYVIRETRRAKQEKELLAYEVW